MTQSPNNMFSDMFKQFTDKDVFANWQKNFNLGNLDSASYMEAMQKNLDAMMKAGQISAENSQAIIKRLAEVVQKQVGEAIEVSKDFISSSNPEHALQKQQQYLKNATSNAINNSKEMVEMGAKSVMEVYDIFTKRMHEEDNKNSKKSK